MHLGQRRASDALAPAGAAGSGGLSSRAAGELAAGAGGLAGGGPAAAAAGRCTRLGSLGFAASLHAKHVEAMWPARKTDSQWPGTAAAAATRRPGAAADNAGLCPDAKSGAAG